MLIALFAPAFLLAAWVARPSQKWALGGLVGLTASIIAATQPLSQIRLHGVLEALGFVGALAALFYYLVRTRQIFGMRDRALWSVVAVLIVLQILHWATDLPRGWLMASLALLALLAFLLGATREYWRLGDPRRVQPNREG